MIEYNPVPPKSVHRLRIMSSRDQLIAEARRDILQPVYEGISGARRSTKRDAVEAAFQYAMEWAVDDDGDIMLDYNQCEQKMYDHVYRRMTSSSIVWFLLWLVVRAAVWNLVVKLVEWLLTRETEA